MGFGLWFVVAALAAGSLVGLYGFFRRALESLR
jgi:hypothetical protein